MNFHGLSGKQGAGCDGDRCEEAVVLAVRIAVEIDAISSLTKRAYLGLQ